jgi:hypothetical protein
MADLVRACDWGSTSLGPVAHWSPEHLCMANLVLAAPNAAVLYWGPDLIQLYITTP